MSHQIYSKSIYFNTNKTCVEVPTSMQMAVNRNAQGLLYVPPSTHKAIRWSNKDPLLEAETHNVSCHIANLSDKKEHLRWRSSQGDKKTL
ncbi:MAG TPA: hypothetical protein VEP90_08070 [Methylomirabilota bacterium]|nr:hypothetical protein [Methylomirabilota bacterium]